MASKVLLTKPTQDCHDRGVRNLARRFRDAGFEVIFTNFLLVDEIVATAIQEDVDVIGVSSSSGGHLPVLTTLMAELAAAQADDVLVIAGGIIPASDWPTLESAGIARAFEPGVAAGDIIEFVKRRLSVGAA